MDEELKKLNHDQIRTLNYALGNLFKFNIIDIELMETVKRELLKVIYHRLHEDNARFMEAVEHDPQY